MPSDTNLSNYLLPEWHPVQAILLAWPYSGSDWDVCLSDAQENYRHIIKTLSRKQKLIILLHPSIDLVQWKKGVSLLAKEWRNIHVVNDIHYDDTWVRDYGPLSLRDGYLNCVFDGWGKKYSALNDNSVNKKLFEKSPEALFSEDFVLEGGALEVNGKGILLANKLCILDKKRNSFLNEKEHSIKDFTASLKKLLGVNTIYWLSDICLTGDDTDGHIDTVARFANDLTIVYSGRNEMHHDKNILEKLHQEIEAICSENNLSSVELPTPIVHSMIDDHLLPASYANYLCSNGIIYLPTYGVDEDQEVLSIFEKIFESFEIVPLDCSVLLEQHGSLHCATMQLHHEIRL